MRSIKWPLLALALFLVSPVHGAETTIYEYDALGRLVKSTKSGGPVDGTIKATTFDPAGNRTNQTVTGAPGDGSPTCFLEIWDSTMTVGGLHTFYLTRTGTCPHEFDVTYATANGTAISGTHYYGVSNGNKEVNGSLESISVNTVSGSVQGEDLRWFTMTLSESEATVEIIRNNALGNIVGPEY